MAKYKAGTLKVVHVPQPNKTELLRASIKRRGPKQPSVPLRGPTLVEPNGKRFSVQGNKVSYMNWQLEYGIRATGGLGLFDVRFQGKRIAYEISFQGGMAGHALVIRVISTPFNYDYIFDYILHQSGVIEVRTTASGYIQPDFATEQEKQYGFVNFFNTVGTIHDHHMLYKVDLDVAGVKNSYQTVDVIARNVSYEWEDNTYRIKKQIVKEKKAREKDAVLRYDFQKPKYYVFMNENEKNAYGNSKGYRIDIQNKVKQLYTDDYYITKSCAWTKYQMSVTKRKDLEPFGSSIYNQFTFSDPAVNFDTMLNDNEAIENEDLVAWVNIGGLHIPNTEDIPLTTTVGSSYGFLIKPFGYFDEDPSHGSTTSVLVDKAADGKYDIKTYGTPETSSCPVPKRKTWM
eukprot:gene10713-19489_t